MNSFNRFVLAMVLLLVPLAGFVEALRHCAPEPLPVVLPAPDPGETPGQIAERKRLFVALLLPIIQQENRRLLRDRDRLARVERELASADEISRNDFDWLKQLAADYALDPAARQNPEFFRSMRARVDMLPAALIIAQAALESGWGRAEVSRNGHNFFGHYCFDQDCGTPAPGPGDLRQFDSPRDSVQAYMHNLNSHPAYAALRRQRAQMQAAGKAASGALLADGLLHYSERGEAYVADVKQMIRDNDLDALADY